MPRASINERFGGTELDTDVWIPFYLPHWSSRAETAATYDLGGGELHLSIPADQGLWVPDRHDEPLRVSCIQSGSFSGPLGTTIGQQPIHEGDTVREEQTPMWGYTPLYGHIEVTMRGSVTPRSMFAFWMSGIEDLPERSGEICVAEIFGSDVGDGEVAVGMGIHRFLDPDLTEEFATVPIAIDASADHTYSVDWLPDSITFKVDGATVRRTEQSPDYPMQLMIGVFDYPDRATAEDAHHVPEMWVSRVRGVPLQSTAQKGTEMLS